jgi:alkanesulfonate monooxygenase
MPAEFVGTLVHTSVGDPMAILRGLPVEPEYVRQLARAHEDADFDAVLIATASMSPEGSQIAAYAAAHTDRLTYMVSHRPGFRAPTVAARELATLDQFSAGRVAVHVITGAADAEMKRDGDSLGKNDRYARTDEYLSVLEQAWTAPEPFDYHGDYYHIEGYRPAVRPFERRHISISFGGSSEAAFRVGVKHADVYALYGEPLAETASQIATIREASAQAGRVDTPKVSVSFRVILGATEELAWDRAHAILAQTKAQASQAAAGPMPRASGAPSVGFQRLAAVVDKGERQDRALWTAIASVRGMGALPTLVGTPEIVAEALLDYYDLGVSTFLIWGYDLLDDAVDFGKELIPLVRAESVRRDAHAQRTQ